MIDGDRRLADPGRVIREDLSEEVLYEFSPDRGEDVSHMVCGRRMSSRRHKRCRRPVAGALVCLPKASVFVADQGDEQAGEVGGVRL